MEQSSHQDAAQKTEDQSWASCDIDAASIEACNDTAVEPASTGVQMTSEGLEVVLAGNTYLVSTVAVVATGLVVVAGLAAVYFSKPRK